MLILLVHLKSTLLAGLSRSIIDGVKKGLWIFTTKNRTAANDNNFDGMMCYDENTGEFRSFNPFDDDPNGYLSNIRMNKYKQVR